MSSFSRRDFLKTGALGSLVAGAGLTACATPNGRTKNWKGEAKNVIFLVSDGMSLGTLTMADHMMQRQYGKSSRWVDLYREQTVKRRLMDMASLDSMVTDSAAAASSWGCGHRINNGAVNMGPNGEEYAPLLPLFRNAGKKTGLVTTTRITHATPSGFIANMSARGMEDEIAAQMLARRPDLLLGGGTDHFEASKRKDGRDMYAEFASAGYGIAKTKTEMKNASADGPLLGLFFPSHLPYTVDHLNIEEYQQNIPTLAEMTDVALKRLSNSNGFILQVEGGRVDHAAHGTDSAGLIYDQIAFDDAVAVAYEFALANLDTLLIITSDHGNANPGLSGDGPGYRNSNPKFDSIQRATRSNDLILRMLDRESSISRIREAIETYTTHAITTDEAGMLRASLNGTYRGTFGKMNAPHGVLSGIMGNYTMVTFVSGAHTSDYVELAAYGPGSETLDGVVVNTQLFDLVLEAAGVSKQL